jgi:transposase
VDKRFDESAAAMRDASVFVITLGTSRNAFDCIILNQRIETWLRVHRETFACVGGVPETIDPDSLKS